MRRDRRVSSHDPTAERAVDQSTPSASGLTAGKGQGAVQSRDAEDELVNRRTPDTTPRRYDQPPEEDER